MKVRRLPLAPTFGPPDVVRAASATVASLLSSTPGLVSAMDAAANAAAWAEELTARVAARIRPTRPIACAEGCAYCCHLKVLTTAPEAIRIAEYLRKSLAPDALAAVRDRVAKTDAVTRGMSMEERARARVPCPLLENGRCAAYPVRPLACRGANSYDAAACERGFHEPDAAPPLPFYKPQHQVMEALLAGVSNGAGANGLDGTPLELVAGLRIALESRGAATTWARGGPSFVPAHDRELVATMQADRASA